MCRKSRWQKSKGTHWVALFIYKYTAVYYDFFGIEYIPQEILNKVRDESITHNNFNTRSRIYYVWILLYRFHRIYACRKNLLDYTILCFPNDHMT